MLTKCKISQKFCSICVPAKIHASGTAKKQILLTQNSKNRMKKLIALSSILAAGTLCANAAVTLSADQRAINQLLPTLTSITWQSSHGSGWQQNIASPSSITADIIKTNIGVRSVLAETGWYAGVGNGNLSTSDISSVTSTGFTFVGRTKYGGEYVVSTIELSDLNLAAKETLTDISISFDVTGSTSTFGFSVYSWNGTTATQLYNVTNTSSVSCSLSNLKLTADDTIIAVFNNTSGGANCAISNLSSSAVVFIPEPSMFGLLAGTLALGLAGTRRRRGNAK